MTEMNLQISNNEIPPYQQLINLQLKKILFKIIPYKFVVYEFNPTIFERKFWKDDINLHFTEYIGLGYKIPLS